MNAPLQLGDGRDRLRQHIAETAGVLIAHAEILQRYCDVSDEAGIRTSCGHIVLHTKAIIKAHNALVEATRAIVKGGRC